MHEPLDELGERALLYANGALDGAELAEFESMLAADQSARDALCRAVTDGPTLPGVSRLPGIGYRQRVRARLLPGGWWVRLFGPRMYRGHPLAWGLSGAIIATLVFAAITSVSAPLPPPYSAPTAARTRPPKPAQTPLPSREETEANVYGELMVNHRLADTVAEIKNRRGRSEKRQGPVDIRNVKPPMK